MPIRKLNQDEETEVLGMGGNPAEFFADSDTGKLLPATKIDSGSSALGFGARTVGKSLVPAAAGGLGMLGTAAALAGAPETMGLSLLPLLAGAGSAYLAGRAQNAVLKKAAPELQQQMDVDTASYPLTSTALSTAAGAPLAGGGYALKNLAQLGGRNIAKLAGAQAGINAAQQMVQNRDINPMHLDLPELATAAGVGALTSVPSGALRGVQRNVVSRLPGMSTARLNHVLPEFTQLPTVPATALSPEQIAAMRSSPKNPDNAPPLGGLDAEVLQRGDGPFLKRFYEGNEFGQLIGNLKEKGMNPTEEDLTRIWDSFRTRTPTADIIKAELVPVQNAQAKAGLEAEAAAAPLKAADAEAAAEEARAKLIKSSEAPELGSDLAAAKEAEINLQADAATKISKALRQIKTEESNARAILEPMVDENGLPHPGTTPEQARHITGLNAKLAELKQRRQDLAPQVHGVGQIQGHLDQSPAMEGAPAPVAFNGTPETPVQPVKQTPQPVTPTRQEMVVKNTTLKPEVLAKISAATDAQVLESLKHAEGTSHALGQAVKAEAEKRGLLGGKKKDESLGPEKVVAVAQKIGGKVVVGEKPNDPHWKIIEQEAARTGKNFEDLDLGDRLKDAGFMTNRGRFVGREEAAKLMGVQKVEPSYDSAFMNEKGEPYPKLLGRVKNAEKPPIELHIGLPEGSLKSALATINKYTLGLSQKPEGIAAAEPHRFAAALDHVAAFDKDLASELGKMPINVVREAGPMLDHLVQHTKSLTEAERQRISEFRYQQKDNGGRSDVVLTPKEARANQAIDDVTKLAALKREGRMVKDFDENGATVYRPNKLSPYFSAEALSNEGIKVLQDLNNPRRQEFREDQIAWEMRQRGVPRANAEKLVDLQYFSKPHANASSTDLAYNALRFAEGVGINPKWRANVIDATARMLHKQGLDIALANLENNPAIGRQLGFTEDANGVKYPTVVLDKAGRPVEPLAGGRNKEVGAILRSMTHMVSPESAKFEAATRALTGGLLGVPTEGRNILQAFGLYSELLHPSEYKFVAKALSRFGTQEQYNKGVAAGAVKPARNVGQGVSMSAYDTVNRYTDLYNRYTGVEALNKYQRVMNYDIAEQLAWNRLAKGDEAFFDKHGPSDWRELGDLEAVRYTAAQIASKIGGTHDFRQLPAKLLPGSSDPLKYIFGLSRWSIGRSNDWIKNVWQPATTGNLKPLLASTLIGLGVTAPLVEWFNEQINHAKPKELTWKEWLNLGQSGSDRDNAYTWLSKNALASNMGIIGDLAFMTAQLGDKESPRGYNSVLLSGVGNIKKRLQQYVTALSEGKATLAGMKDGLPRLVFELMRDNVQNLRMLTPRDDESGLREERLARHTGFLPAKDASTSHSLPNPWSERAAYQEGNEELLKNIEAEKIKEALTGKTKFPSAPGSALRAPGYYDFINKAQGAESAQTAVKRDVNETIKRSTMFGRALPGAVGKALTNP